MTSILLLTLAGIYRPYMECEGVQPRIQIEVVQNSDMKNGLPMYKFNLKKKSRGSILEVRDLAATRIPTKRKDVLEIVTATNQKGVTDYQLMVFKNETEEGYVAQLMDRYSVRTVFCSYNTSN